MVTETNKIIAVQSILKIAAALSAGDMNRMEFCVTAEKRGEHLLGSSKSPSLKYVADWFQCCPINIAAPLMLLLTPECCC
jgi:hypothetical protein